VTEGSLLQDWFWPKPKTWERAFLLLCLPKGYHHSCIFWKQYHSKTNNVKIKLSTKKYGCRALERVAALLPMLSKGLPPPPALVPLPLERAVVVDAGDDEVVVLVLVLMEAEEVMLEVFELSDSEEEDDDAVSVVVVLRSVEELADWELLAEAVDPAAVVPDAAVVFVFVDAAAVVPACATVVVVVKVSTAGSHKKPTASPRKIFPINESRSAFSWAQARCTDDCAVRMLDLQFEEQEPDPPMPCRSLRWQLLMLPW
jgi:hypothetical protein